MWCKMLYTQQWYDLISIEKTHKNQNGQVAHLVGIYVEQMWHKPLYTQQWYGLISIEKLTKPK